MYISDQDFSFIDSAFTSNTAGDGGGLMVWASEQMANFQNVVFSLNTATSAGGGLYFGNIMANISMLDCSVSDNDAGTVEKSDVSLLVVMY
jgi:predicted outer membrane repeat protein